jgi:TonB family protein
MLANTMDITLRPPGPFPPSRIRIEGDLAKLRLLTPVHLPPQTNADVLPDTKVQMMVDARGRVLSPVVVTSCMNPDTDKTALDFAETARFEPIKAAAIGTVIPDKITFGTMVFEWQTVPPAATNAPATSP